MKNRYISLIHPFTSGAVGLKEKQIPKFHSQPHALALIKLINEKGYDCYIDYFTSNFFSYKKNYKSLKYRFFPVSLSFNGDHKKWKKQVSRNCINFYNKNTPDYTIINMSGHSSNFSYELSKVILLNKKKYIPMLGGQHYTNNLRNKKYYRNADHILVHTNNQKNEMLKMELFKDLDIRVFPLGVDTSLFKPKTIISDIKLIENPKLLYVGRIIEWKRIHLAIESLSQLVQNGFKKASLKIIGPISSNNYFIDLNNLINDRGLCDNVEFIKQQKHKDLISYFQNADLLVLPSNLETFGMVMIESMACGTPVAAINCPGGPSEVIKNNYNGILSSVDNYGKSIIDYFNNSISIDKIKTNAVNTVYENYSIENTYRVLVKSIDG